MGDIRYMSEFEFETDMSELVRKAESLFTKESLTNSYLSAPLTGNPFSGNPLSEAYVERGLYDRMVENLHEEIAIHKSENHQLQVRINSLQCSVFELKTENAKLKFEILDI